MGRDDMLRWARERRIAEAGPRAVALVGVTALAAFLRFWQLHAVPPGFHYDEAYEALEAWQILTRPGYHPIFFPGNFGVEPAFIYFTAAAFRLFGETPVVMRGVAALLGTLTIPMIYAAGREMARSDERIPPGMPLLAALSLAILRWHIHFSRVGIEPVLVPLDLAVLLWAFWRGLHTNQLAAWIVLGAAVGFGPYTYPAGRLMPVVGLAVLGWVWLTDRNRLRGRWRGLLLAGGVAAVVFAPLGWHWLRHPEQLLLRSSQIVAGAGEPSRGTPMANLLATLGMFNWRGDRDPRNNVPGMPALDVLMSVPFLIGLALALWRWRRPVFGALPLIGLIMLVPTVFSEYAPHFRRALGATPAVALACGLGLAVLLGRWQSRWRTAPEAVPPRLQGGDISPEVLAGEMDRLRALGRAAIVVAIVAGSAVYGATAYFVRWGQSSAVYYAYDQGLWDIGQYVLGLPQDELVYVTPRPATHTTLAFAWRGGRVTRHFDGRHAFRVPAGAERPAGMPLWATYVVIEHEDFRGGRLLRELYPGAVEAKTFLDRDGRVYARAFRVPAGAPLSRAPRHPVQASWPGADLIGYDLDRAAYRPGDIVYLQLWWRATGAPEADWTVFVHLLGRPKADGNTVWAARDAQPGQGSAPMSSWVVGELVLDEYQIQLPPDMPRGEYQIEVGLYELGRQPERALTTNPAGRDHVLLGSVRVE